MRRWQVISSAAGFLAGLAVLSESMMFSRAYFVGFALVILSLGGFVFCVQNASRARQARRREQRGNNRR